MLGLGYKVAGLSIEESGIRYISLQKNKTWEIRKKRTLPLLPGMIVENQVADGEALLEQIKTWVKKEGLRGTKVALTIPPSQIIIRKMSIPTTNDKQLEQLVKLEVETGLHLPFDSPVYDYVITGMDEEQSHLLVFAAPRKPIQDYMDILEKAGLKVNSVELSATALARSITLGVGKSFAETMLIHLEQSMMDIYMFREGNPVFIRTISLHDLHQDKPALSTASIDGDYAAEAAAAAAIGADEHLSPEQMVEITAEISRMLNFYQYSLHDGSARISNVLITGTPVLRTQLHQELRQSLAEVDIVPLSLEQLGEGTALDLELNSYRVAAGAALGSRERHINLLPQEDREAIIFPYIAVALVGVWLLGVIGTGLFYAMNKGELSDQEQQLQGLQDRGTMLQLELSKLTSTGAGQLDRKSAVEEILKYKLSAVSVLNELTQGLPQGGVLRDIVYTYRTSIELTTNMPSMEAASVYLSELRGMSFTLDANIQKLSEGENDSSSAYVPGESAKIYKAVYKVNMSAVNQQNTGTEISQGEVDSDGANQ